MWNYLFVYFSTERQWDEKKSKQKSPDFRLLSHQKMWCDALRKRLYNGKGKKSFRFSRKNSLKKNFEFVEANDLFFSSMSSNFDWLKSGLTKNFKITMLKKKKNLVYLKKENLYYYTSITTPALVSWSIRIKIY